MNEVKSTEALDYLKNRKLYGEDLKNYRKATKNEVPGYIRNRKPRGTNDSVKAPENMKNRGAYPK